MKCKCLVIVILAVLFSCADKNQNIPPDAKLQAAAALFNQIKSDEKEAIDSSSVARLEKAALFAPAEYKAMANICWGMYYNNKSSYELGIKNFEKALLRVKRRDADTLLALAYHGIGNGYKHTGDYPKALHYLYQGLQIFETRKDTGGIARANACLGEVHMQKGDFASAKENLKIALKLLDRDKSQPGWLSAAHTLANVYGMSGDYKKALAIDEVGIGISDSIKSLRAKSTFLDNKANCYMFSGKLDSAEYYFRECLKIDFASGSKKQIADSYSNLGALAAFQKDFAKAETLTKKSIGILKSVNNKFSLSKSYQVLAEIYTQKGDYKKAHEADSVVFEEYKKMVNEKKEASLAEFRILHETDRKEKELAEKRVELIEKNGEVRQRNYLLAVLGLLLVFIGLIGLMLNRQHKLKTRQMAQQHELKTAIAKIESQNELQKQRLNISRDLHDNIGAQLTFIISSVENLKYVFDLTNTTLGAKLENISAFTRDTIVELRDTIWAMNHSEITFEDLRARILNFIEKAKSAQETTRFRFSIDDELSGVKLTSIQGMNIYRTIQEAVNNALKYARADEISIEIKSVRRGIDIEICDDGSGFDTDTIEKGNGLANIQKRINDIGGEISLESNVGKGTIIGIHLPEDLKQTQTDGKTPVIEIPTK